ncbi:MAG: TonB-dependent receptor [Xanthomonadales bacterium]|nr:TonB-dependent receptor [Xanthomonadales bacterium]
MSGHDLWQLLDQLARDTRRSLIFEVEADALRAVPHAPLRGSFEVAAALDALLHDTPFRWRVDAHGQIVIFRAESLNLSLSPLNIDGQPITGGSSAATNARSIEGPPGAAPSPVTLGQRLDGAVLAPLHRADISLLGRRAPNVSGAGPQLAIRGVELGLGLSTTATLSVDGMPLSADFALQGELPARLSAIDYLRGPRTSLDALGGLGGAIRVFSDEPAPPAQGEWRLRGLAPAGFGLGVLWAPSDALSGHSWMLNASAGRRERNIQGVDETSPASADQAQIVARGIYEPDLWPGFSLRWSALAYEGEPHRRPVVPPTGVDRPGFDPLDGRSFDPFRHDESLSFRSGLLRADYDAGPAQFWVRGAGFDSSLSDRRTSVQSVSESLSRLDLERYSTVAMGAQMPWSDHWLARLELSQGRRRKQERERSRTRLDEYFPSGNVQFSDPSASRVLQQSAIERLTEDAVLFEVRGNHAPWSWGAGARGVRYTRRDARAFRAFVDPSDCSLSGSGGTRPCSDEFPLSDSSAQIPSRETHVSPAVDVGWQPTDHTSLSLWWRRGLRPGGARSDPGTGRLVPYRAERSESLDLHTSIHFERPSLTLNATLFAVRWDDRQVRVDLPVAQSFLVANAGSADSRGAEIELRWQANDRFSLWVELGFLHTSFDRFPFPVAGGTVDLAGNRLPGAPRYSRGVGAAWSHPAGWHWQANLWQVADAYSDATNTEVGRRDGYSVLDVYVDRSLGAHWSVSVSATNLLDRRYLEHVRVAGIQPTAREYWLGDRRKLQLEVAYRW